MQRYQFPTQMVFMQSVEQTQPIKTSDHTIAALEAKPSKVLSTKEDFIASDASVIVKKGRSRKFT
jgi:hypothetical protein